MIPRWTLALVIAVGLGTSRVSVAQVQRAGTLSIDRNRMYTRVFIAMGDANAPPYPIKGVRVLLIDSAADTITLRTDGTGAAEAFVPRGEYYLVTVDSVRWLGWKYSWMLPLHVGKDMRDVELTVENSTSPEIRLARRPGTTPVHGLTTSNAAGDVTAVRGASVSGRRTVMAPTGIAWEILEEDFSRAAVAGTDLPLPRKLKVLLFNRRSETRQLDDYPVNWRELPDSTLLNLLLRARRIRP